MTRWLTLGSTVKHTTIFYTSKRSLVYKSLSMCSSKGMIDVAITECKPISWHRTDRMNVFDGRHFRINKSMLALIGQWPFQTSRTQYISLVVFFALAGTQILAKLCATIVSGDDMDGIMEDISPLVVDLAFVVKLINSGAKMKLMRKLLTRVQFDYTTVRAGGELKVMQEYAEDGRKFTIIYLGAMSMSMLCFMIPPLKIIFFTSRNETSERYFIHHTEYFVDPLDYYYLIILHSYITIFLVVYTIVTMDTMLVLLVQHACGLFKALGYRLCHLTCDNNLLIDINPSRSSDKSFVNISLCVRRHQEALEFAKLMDSYYTTPLFMQTGINVIALSVAGAKAMTSTDVNNFFHHVSIFFSSVAHIFFECVNGQRLIDHSNRMHEYLVDVKWYQTSLRTRRILNLMIVRSRFPCVLTGASMFEISMETFSAVLRTSMSYFTVLRSAQ